MRCTTTCPNGETYETNVSNGLTIAQMMAIKNPPTQWSPPDTGSAGSPSGPTPSPQASDRSRRHGRGGPTTGAGGKGARTVLSAGIGRRAWPTHPLQAV